MKKKISILLCFALLLGAVGSLPQKTAEAAAKTLLLSQAKKMALAESASYRKIKSKIALKEVSYKQAVKSLQLKKKNMSTFRWTPLLSFKFPEKADLADESEFVYKPAQIQSEITGLKHDLIDEVYSVYEKTANLYTEVYGLQETIAFQEQQQRDLKSTLSRNRTRLLLGQANQTDIDSIEKAVKNLETSLVQNMRKFETKKQGLSDLIGLDVTTRYQFKNPYVDAPIPREKLKDLVKYTLDHDQAYYEAKLDTKVALLSLNTNYDLMENQYGWKMSYISTYVQQAKSGGKLDSDAFKKSYDEFLKVIDEPWQGKKRILFLRIPKEWFKGAIDGVRYVEDEPYALFEAALEYQEKLIDEKQMAKDLEKQVKDTFESIVTARSAYLNLREQVKNAEQELEKSRLLNSMGECTFEEYTEAQNQYEELQMDELEALQLYTTLLYSYDRLTCGAVSAYLKGAGVSLEGGGGGESYVVKEDSEGGARYYIRPIVEENLFEFGIYLPEDFETDITHYELWCDGIQIGDRTEIDKTIRHLTLSLETIDRVFVRVYNEEEFVDDCDIDAEVYEGELTITGSYRIEKIEVGRTVGSYTVQKVEGTSLAEIMLNFDSAEGVASYAIQDSAGKFLLSGEPVPVTDRFRYLDFLTSDMSGLVVKCYDSEKNFLYDVQFQMSEYSLTVRESE